MSTQDERARSKVLVVDDSGAVRSLFDIALDAAGYSVTTAGSAADALAACALAPPDVAVVDIFLERTNGLDLIRAMRSAYPTVRVIAMTGGGPDGNFDVLLSAKDLGAIATLEKPLSWRRLIDAVEQVLGV